MPAKMNESSPLTGWPATTYEVRTGSESHDHAPTAGYEVVPRTPDATGGRIGKMDAAPIESVEDDEVVVGEERDRRTVGQRCGEFGRS